MPDCFASTGGMSGCSASNKKERSERARTHEEKERGKDQAEQQRSCQVCVVHDVRVDGAQRVEHCQRFLQDMVKVDPEFCERYAIISELSSRGKYRDQSDSAPPRWLSGTHLAVVEALLPSPSTA